MKKITKTLEMYLSGDGRTVILGYPNGKEIDELIKATIEMAYAEGEKDALKEINKSLSKPI